MKSKTTTMTLRLKPKDEIKAMLEAYVRTNKIKAACIITCVGSLDVTAIRFANLPDATIIAGKLEIV